MKEQKHVCCGCGAEAKYQMKNGKWYCTQNARSCPRIKQKVKEKALSTWKDLKQKGIKQRKDIPEQQRIVSIDKGQEHICYYCGEHADYQLANGRWCCKQSYNSCPAIRQKNSKKRKQQCKNGIASNNLKTYSAKGSIPWNKGLTKQTSISMQKISNTLKQEYQSGQLKKRSYNHTKETKQYLSKLRSQQIANGVHGGFNDVKWYNINFKKLEVGLN